MWIRGRPISQNGSSISKIPKKGRPGKGKGSKKKKIKKERGKGKPTWASKTQFSGETKTVGR